MQAGMWFAIFAIVFLSSVYVLWKRHPNYGASPGAPSFPIIGCLPALLLNKHRYHEWTCDLFEQSHGLTRSIRLGSDILLFTIDPTVVRHVLKDSFTSYPKGPIFYPYFEELLGQGILNSDGPLWVFQRKVASHIFTSNSLRTFILSISDSEISSRLLPGLAAAQHMSSDSVDMQDILIRCIFDMICQITLGMDPVCLKFPTSGTMEEADHIAMSCTEMDARHQRHDEVHEYREVLDEKHGVHGGIVKCSLRSPKTKVPDSLVQGFVQGFQAATRISAERFLVPRFLWTMKRFLRIGSERELLQALEQVNEFTTFLIKQSKKEIGKGRKDLLARFIHVSDETLGAIACDDMGVNACIREQERSTISDSLLRDILLNFLLAGLETVASAVTFTLWIVSTHPEIERRVLREISSILADREQNGGGEEDAIKVGTFTYEEVRKMDYMHAVISETMRLYPPVPADCKYAAEDDVLPDGTKVSKGYRIGFMIFAMGRSAKLWGEDCLDFRPERWLDHNGHFQPVSAFKYPVFQAGPRICLGKDFAFIQMKLLLASLLMNFEFAVHAGFKPKLSYGITLSMVNGLPMTVRRRITLVS
ncbi:hypothetical protein KP509_28G032700 [Ceratopteris richardii]|uniref:Cytochrome P450 n=1 Tax=Ceratopteris richardii TaxID=49495 RepID=A0A8T2RDJ7_CERRI|nr:hypothetical protein KP509_28G032700 [Ceratopteris richardii]